MNCLRCGHGLAKHGMGRGRSVHIKSKEWMGRCRCDFEPVVVSAKELRDAAAMLSGPLDQQARDRLRQCLLDVAQGLSATPKR